MRKINRRKTLVTSIFGIITAVVGICCVIMEWGTGWYLLISVLYVGILIHSITEQRCPYCGKYAVNASIGKLIAKREVHCKKCGEHIEYEE